MPLYGAVETGGTKLLARVLDAAGTTIAEGRWPTSTPEQAALDLVTFFRPRRVDALGMAAFGPLIVDGGRPNYGEVLPTTKPHWTGSNLRRRLSDQLGVPVAVDTDVNAAALAEQRLGAGCGTRSCAYVTVGTGIGGGLALDGVTLKGGMHPEIGHLRLHRQPGDDHASACRFHPDCAEGLAAGPAVRARLQEGQDLADCPEISALIAAYLGELFAQLVLAWSPERLVVGGGVMSTPGLLAATRAPMLATLAGFGVGDAPAAPGFLVPAQLQHAGLEGAAILARDPALVRLG